MNNNRNRISITILGFFIFVTPIFFFCYDLDKEYKYAKNQIQENLKEKLINSANQLEENLDCYNYLKSEINKIHEELFPNISKEVLEKIPEESYANNLYTKELLDIIIHKTKDKFNPLMINLGTKDFEKLYGYFSPELEKAFKGNEKDRELLLNSISFFDMDLINYKYSCSFQKKLPPEKTHLLYSLYMNIESKSLTHSFYLEPCYKYISRFSNYSRYNEPLYTDYFSKQSLYVLTKFTLSKNGIYGFYSLIIPQSSIDPTLIRKNAISKIDSEVKISFENKTETSEIKQKDNGFEYSINIPSKFANHIKAYKRLKEIDQTSLLKKQINLSISLPAKFICFTIVNKITKFLPFLTVFLYIILSIVFISSSTSKHITLTKKLIYVLSIIIFLPILGIGFFTLILSHNLNELVDINLSKNLHNSLENYSLINKEIIARRFSTSLEMKRRISKTTLSNLYKESLIDIFEKNNIQKKQEVLNWFLTYNSDISIINEKGDLFQLDNENGYAKEHDKTRKLVEAILSKYINNLGIALNLQDKNKEIFILTYLEQYINKKAEEKSVTQESIPSKDLIFLTNFDSSMFYYSKDIKNTNYFIYTRSNTKNGRPYNFLSNYININPFWYQPSYKYGYDTNLAITLYYNDTAKNNNRQQYPTSSINNNINELFNRILVKSDSGYEKKQNKKETIINEYIFSNETPFVIAGTAKSQHNNHLALITKLIFPFLIVYATLILILLSNLISSFIKQPVIIYNEALDKLRDNYFGITIESFSNDEFNSITQAFNEMSVAINQKEQMKRYVSDRLVKSVESNQNPKSIEGKLEKVTILSSDIRNFTGTSEKYEPSAIVEMLNSYFTKMQKAISDNGGIIDKYIGDAIQAVFYDEQDKENQVIRAAKAAVAMRKALKKFNEERESKGLFTIENGIGIDTDYAITGTIGTTEGRKDFSVNGDVIARAAELEAKTKKTTSKILISKASLEELCPQKPLLEEGNKRGGDLTRVKPNSMDKLSSQENWIATQSTTARNDGSNSNIDNDNKTNHTPLQSHLVFKDFDSDSVELIDVRE